MMTELKNQVFRLLPILFFIQAAAAQSQSQFRPAYRALPRLTAAGETGGGGKTPAWHGLACAPGVRLAEVLPTQMLAVTVQDFISYR